MALTWVARGLWPSPVFYLDHTLKFYLGVLQESKSRRSCMTHSGLLRQTHWCTVNAKCFCKNIVAVWQVTHRGQRSSVAVCERSWDVLCPAQRGDSPATGYVTASKRSSTSKKTHCQLLNSLMFWTMKTFKSRIWIIQLFCTTAVRSAPQQYFPRWF